MRRVAVRDFAQCMIGHAVNKRTQLFFYYRNKPHWAGRDTWHHTQSTLLLLNMKDLNELWHTHKDCWTSSPPRKSWLLMMVDGDAKVVLSFYQVSFFSFMLDWNWHKLSKKEDTELFVGHCQVLKTRGGNVLLSKERGALNERTQCIVLNVV